MSRFQHSKPTGQQVLTDCPCNLLVDEYTRGHRTFVVCPYCDTITYTDGPTKNRACKNCRFWGKTEIGNEDNRMCLRLSDRSTATKPETFCISFKPQP